ncbi:MAG TPA: PilZ domain-containing protein [Candidatus Dormibacteraeota bacterium]|nr:PilZ domain-containing protein [Candidatus Dormibacteraeota bacterium]
MVERRNNPRFKIGVPVEIHTEGSAAPLHCATSDLSLGGCYIESMYPFPVGTCLELKLEASETLLISARVVTCDPQFGNGIQFLRMLPEDRTTLARFLEHVAHQEVAGARKV